jgi:LuxR family maltose regulon positive regulatory protein
MAIAQFYWAGDWDDSARLICLVAKDVERHGRAKTLEKWIIRLPQATIDGNPWLSYWLGRCARFTQPVAARGQFESAFHGFEQAGDTAGMILAWCGVITASLVAWADFRYIGKWIDVGNKLLADHPDFPSDEIESRMVCNMCFALIFSRPECPELPELTERTLHFLQTSNAPNFQLMGSLLLAFYLLWLGDIARVRLLLDGLRRCADDPDPAAPHRIMWLSGKAYFSLKCASPDEALQAARDGLALSRESGFRILDDRLIGASIQAHLLKRDHAAARNALRIQQDALPSGQNIFVFHQHWLSAWAEWVCGRSIEAFEHLSIARQVLEAIGCPAISSAKNELATAIVRYDLDEQKQAQEALAKARHIGRMTRSDAHEHHCLLIEADWALNEHREKQGLDALRKAFRIGRKKGIFITEWWDPARMSYLCAKALKAGTETDHVCAVITKNGLEPDALGQTLQNWPWVVSVSTLGYFRILRDGHSIASTGKEQKKVIELLKALIAFGGTAVSVSHLIDALWPDADADAAHNALKSTVHRLRIKLGHSEALEFHDHLLSLNTRCCWVDVWAFERLFKAGINDERGIEQLERATRLYPGAFLSADDSFGWVITPRERLRRQFIRAVEKMGSHWSSLEQWEKAIDTYEQGLEIDSLAEPFYLRLMECCERLGDRGEALEVYRRCTKTMNAQLGTLPSERTRSFAQRVQGG